MSCVPLCAEPSPHLFIEDSGNTQTTTNARLLAVNGTIPHSRPFMEPRSYSAKTAQQVSHYRESRAARAVGRAGVKRSMIADKNQNNSSCGLKRAASEHVILIELTDGYRLAKSASNLAMPLGAPQWVFGDQSPCNPIPLCREVETRRISHTCASVD